MSEVQRVSRQHLISQVLLKRFTLPGAKGSGWQLVQFDLEHPERHHKLKGPRECGWIEDFVPYDSASAEDLWRQVEQRAPEAFAAVDAGTPFDDPEHAQILRDLVSLHLVRSHRYRDVYRDAFVKARENVRRGLLQNYGEQLRTVALRETGLHLEGVQALGVFADRMIESSDPAQDHDSGKMFRVSIEEMFQKVQDKAASWQLEVLTPQEGQFLIGDNPAITLHWGETDVKYGMAFGDAHTVVLPLGPRHLLALGPQNRSVQVPKALVDQLNAVQVLAANRYVYLRQRSGLEPFVKAGVESRSRR
ncbi:DUF4238 domain-containing protein [Streptomyces sp. NBC_00885]|uniref:DUF4238 domain-containing protein n=1 Tax=Streptomyces sp. NBC_00885 TaxID=2975857 RepID=UPI003868FE76|nr:DUF4238 domain-containing protein [Streptomyces sp. NBC_00885]